MKNWQLPSLIRMQIKPGQHWGSSTASLNGEVESQNNSSIYINQNHFWLIMSTPCSWLRYCFFPRLCLLHLRTGVIKHHGHKHELIYKVILPATSVAKDWQCISTRFSSPVTSSRPNKTTTTQNPDETYLLLRTCLMWWKTLITSRILLGLSSILEARFIQAMAKTCKTTPMDFIHAALPVPFPTQSRMCANIMLRCYGEDVDSAAVMKS